MISFIIPAHDEEALIGETIDAIRAACRSIDEAFEIIVSDDASTDRTVEVALAHGARVVRGAKRQIAATRNLGARAARGRYLVFVDADTLVPEATLASAVAALESGAIGGGCAVSFEGEVPFVARILVGAIVRLMRLAQLASGCFLFCTREAFEVAGGFSEARYAGEELFLSWALKREGRFEVLQEPVITSSRKLRTHSYRELFGTLLLPLVKGPRAFHDRSGLDVWYGERRPDPGRERREDRAA